VLKFASVLQLLLTVNDPSSPIPVSLMYKISLSETSVLKRNTRRHFPEDGIFIVAAVKASDLT
jgi:hypothetical protein